MIKPRSGVQHSNLPLFVFSSLLVGILSLVATFSDAAGLYKIDAERPVDFSIRACSYQPSTSDEQSKLLFFGDNLELCSTLRTTKNVLSLASPFVYTTLHEVGSPYRCSLTYLGYGGEYRLAPDLGHYQSCQKAIAHYTSLLAISTEPVTWNTTRNAISPLTAANCPIQSLPSRYRDYLACTLKHRWYELQFKSSIRYEVFHKRRYFSTTSNHTSTFLFKPGLEVTRNGTELDWLQTLVNVDVRPKQCQRARYLIRVDDAFPLTLTAFIDYRVRQGGFIKYSRHLGNGTLDSWFSGAFVLEPSDYTHELCVQIVYRGSFNRYKLCRAFLQPDECRFASRADHIGSWSSAIVAPILLLLATIV